MPNISVAIPQPFNPPTPNAHKSAIAADPDPMAQIDPSAYSHSPIHAAVLAGDHAALRLLLSALPSLSDPSTVLTESASLSEEAKADAISSSIDRRDVPGRETPLHLAVRLSDLAAADLLLSAGADFRLHNALGWGAAHEAVCSHDEPLLRSMLRRHPGLSWSRWRRRLPRLVSALRRMRDFYMEISFHFDSPLPLVSRFAPSDTYRIWKRGASLRADMTISDFDGFHFRRGGKTVLFLGDGNENGNFSLHPGSICGLFHEKREFTRSLQGPRNPPTEEDIQRRLAELLKTSNIMRPGIDVTRAELVPQMTWRRKERKEMVGPWNAKVYDMHNVVVSLSERLAGGTPGKEKASSCDTGERVELSSEEEKELEAFLEMKGEDGLSDCYPEKEPREILNDEVKMDDRQKKIVEARSSVCVEGKASELPEKPMVESAAGKGEGDRKLKNGDMEYKHGLMPALWLSPDFPLQTDELLPLLEILENKVKAIRRLRELLTTKLPPGTFPVKVAIPVVPTIRVLVTFTKFEEIQPTEEFSTLPSRPKMKSPVPQSWSSWRHWMKGTNHGNSSPVQGASSSMEAAQDLFMIPTDYTWITPEEMKNRLLEKKRKASKEGDQSRWI